MTKDNDEGERTTGDLRPTEPNTGRPAADDLHRLERDISCAGRYPNCPMYLQADDRALEGWTLMYNTIDLRDEPQLNTIPEVCQRIVHYRGHYPALRAVIISRSQRTHLVSTDPVLLQASKELGLMFEKLPQDVDFQLHFAGCRVEVE